MEELDRINSERISNLEKALNDRQDHLFKLMSEVKKRNGNGNGNGAWVRQSIGITIAVIALLGFMIPTFVAVVEPIRLQITNQSNAMIKLEERASKQVELLDTKLQIEVMKSTDAAVLANERSKARLVKLEEWQRWWYRNIPARDSAQDTNILAVKELVDEKAKDRFTGKEGEMLRKQIARLEERLTFLTMKWMNENPRKNME